jgi:DNA-binding transcriptional LysR family regulator
MSPGEKLETGISFVKSIDEITGIRMVDIKRFDLNLLRALDALLTESHVSAAARRLNLSQPATSAALTRLRGALDDPILIRDGQRMLLTPLAEWIRPKVRSLLQEIELTLSEPAKFSATTSKRCFRILANDYAITVVLSPLLELLQRHAPNLTMEVLPLEDHFSERLAEGDYDLAVRDRWSLGAARHLERLFKEDFVCIARKDHPRLSKKPTLGEFLAEGHVLISPQGRVPGAVDAPLKRLKQKRRVAVTLPHFLAGPAIVARTDFVMTIAGRIARKYSELYSLRVFSPPLRVPGFEVAMAWPTRGEADPAIHWLRTQIRLLGHY